MMSATAAPSLSDLPPEIRFMIYRLLFCPSTEPIIIPLTVAAPVQLSAQLLRVCKACRDEASPILYGENEFALDWAYPGAEIFVLDFLEEVGPSNRCFIRHLRARHYSILTLSKIRARRNLRQLLENLDSLSLEFNDDTRYLDPNWTALTVLKDVRLFLKTQRGPYRKLVRVLKTETDPNYPDFFSVRLMSPMIKPGPKEFGFSLDAEIERMIEGKL